MPPPTMSFLETTIARRLLQNNSEKYERLEKAGTLKAFLKEQADLAEDAMDSLGPEATDDQRREVASDYLNPLTPEQEMEREMAMDQEPESE